MPAKARCDDLSADRKTIVDAKTAESANPRAVSRKAFAEGWQLRAAWYLEAVALVTGSSRTATSLLSSRSRHRT